jgi:Transposase, Mutator family
MTDYHTAMVPRGECARGQPSSRYELQLCERGREPVRSSSALVRSTPRHDANTPITPVRVGRDVVVIGSPAATMLSRSHRFAKSRSKVAWLLAISTRRREVLGMAVGPSEAEPFWTKFIRSLTGRGLRGVKLVTSDSHEGLKKVARKVLGATWQRCSVHFMRNALANVAAWSQRPSELPSPRKPKKKRLRNGALLLTACASASSASTVR